MTDSSSMKREIQTVIKDMMDRIIQKVTVEDPFLVDEHKAKKPLYAALVPDEIFKGSHFERRFVTPFGKVWERLAVVAGNKGLGFADMGHEITGNINAERLRRIQEVLDKLEHPGKGKQKIKPNWNNEIEYVLAGKSKSVIPTTVICDVFAEDKKNKRKYAFEIKAPLPNSDQTKVSKEKILKLQSMEPKVINDSFYALPYNPYGKREDYAWSFPARWFDMHFDEVVLIGNEFWDKIGGTGTYKAFIKAVNEIGIDYREIIYRDYLGIEPPKKVDSTVLK